MADHGNSFSDTETPINDYDLKEVELRFGFAFPRDVRDHYLRWNGGCPDNYVYYYKETAYVVSEFLPIKHGRQGSLFEDTMVRLKKDQEVIPDYLIPFAVDPGGDYYCFSISDNDHGRIYFFSGEDMNARKNATTRISESLKEFVSNMESDD